MWTHFPFFVGLHCIRHTLSLSWNLQYFNITSVSRSGENISCHKTTTLLSKNIMYENLKWKASQFEESVRRVSSKSQFEESFGREALPTNFTITKQKFLNYLCFHLHQNLFWKFRLSVKSIVFLLQNFS